MYEQKEIALNINKFEWPHLIDVDDTTYQLAKKIESLSVGLTPKQFTDAVSIALGFVSRYTILSAQPCPQTNEQS